MTSVAEYGNISKAAERLYITQPSLSRSLQKIESELGVELFKRTAEGLKPTIAGEAYIKTATKMIALYKELEVDISNISQNHKGRITIGTTFYFSSFILPTLLSSYSQLYPHVEITIIEGTSSEIEMEIVKGIVDIGIIHAPIKNQELEYTIVASEDFLLCVPPDDPINDTAYTLEGYRRPFIDLKLTANRPYILNHPNQRARRESERIMGLAGFYPKIKMVTRSLQTVSRMSAQGLGFALMPYSYARLFNPDCYPKHYNIPKDYAPNWDVAVVYSKDFPLLSVAQELIELCKEILPSMFDSN